MTMNKRLVCSVALVIGLVTGGVALEATQSVGKVALENIEQTVLRISSKGLSIIGNAEGCRLDPYTCPAGRPTNGIGNTHGVQGKEVSLEQVAKDWVKNVEGAEQCIRQAEIAAKKVMTQGQFDAFTSFSFNTGCQRLRQNRNGSTTQIYRYLQQGQFTQACDQLPRWIYGGGVKLKGLVHRREQEYARCMALD